MTSAPNNRTRRVRRVLIALLVIILIATATWFIWLPRVAGAYALFTFRNHDFGSRTVHKDLAVPAATGQAYTFDSIRLNVPWDVPGMIRSHSTSTLVVLFKTSPTQHESLIFFPGLSLHDNLIKDSKVQQFFGSGLKTNYDLYRYTVNLTPADINLFAPVADFQPKLILLITKEIEIISNHGRMYDFETVNGIRGFQTAASATSTIIELFTPKDKDYQLIISGATPQNIDSILQSIKAI